MRGVTYEEKRNRWRCFHVSGARTFQPRFPTEREAFWKKIELCADDGVFPFSKSVKEGNKNAQSSKSGISNLPEYRYKDGDCESRERVIRQAAWDRYEHCKARIEKEAERQAPVNKSLLERLFENTEVALQTELNQCFKESANGLSH